ncbi:hypothetical protein WP50_27205 [Lactiplantibacillus plantarum]|nr:hypothetical protein WP50_27205 [Lactiplantibacillus plantarum]
MSDAYKRAGVDINAGYDVLKTVKQMSGNQQLGAFGGAFPLSSDATAKQGVVDAVGLSTTEPYGGLCMAYFNGDYPTALYDYQAEYDAEIAQLQANHEGVIK